MPEPSDTSAPSTSSSSEPMQVEATSSEPGTSVSGREEEGHVYTEASGLCILIRIILLVLSATFDYSVSLMNVFIFSMYVYVALFY